MCFNLPCTSVAQNFRNCRKLRCLIRKEFKPRNSAYNEKQRRAAVHFFGPNQQTKIPTAALKFQPNNKSQSTLNNPCLTLAQTSSPTSSKGRGEQNFILFARKKQDISSVLKLNAEKRKEKNIKFQFQ